jgi:hypothetical protein
VGYDDDDGCNKQGETTARTSPCRLPARSLSGEYRSWTVLPQVSELYVVVLTLAADGEFVQQGLLQRTDSLSSSSSSALLSPSPLEWLDFCRT